MNVIGRLLKIQAPNVTFRAERLHSPFPAFPENLSKFTHNAKLSFDIVFQVGNGENLLGLERMHQADAGSVLVYADGDGVLFERFLSGIKAFNTNAQRSEDSIAASPGWNVHFGAHWVKFGRLSTRVGGHLERMFS